MEMRAAIVSQYFASLDMLRQAIVACPESLWDDRSYRNVFWHVAYHALFYTHLYLQPSRQDFSPWVGRRGEFESLKNVPRASGETPDSAEPYTKDEILDYLAFCRQQVEERVASVEFEAPSGFSWLPFGKLELQFYNIRHIMQHTGELYERLGVTGEVSLDWIFMRPDAAKDA